MIKEDQIIQGTNNSYKILEVVGIGNISKVFKAVNLQTCEYVAIKVISKIRLGDQNDNLYYEREILILKKLMKNENQHQNIIKIFEIFESNNCQFVVFELLTDGNLIEYLLSKDMNIDEIQALNIMYQVTKAICHLHKLKIMHRDIKPENILLKVDSQHITVKLIDFGVSSQNENSIADSMVGSISYISKEVLLHQKMYNEKCDVWSLGCLFHELITGNQLFCGETIKQIYDQIMSFRQYDQNSKWSYIISKCLEVDIEKRISSKELLDLLQSEYNKYNIQKQSMTQSNQLQEVTPQSCYSSSISTRKDLKIQNRQSLIILLEEKNQNVNSHKTNDYNGCYEMQPNQETLQFFNYEPRKDISMQNQNTIVAIEFPIISQEQKINEEKEGEEEVKVEEEKQEQENVKNENFLCTNQSQIKIIDRSYGSKDLWNDLCSLTNKYFFTKKLKNIEFFYYPNTTEGIRSFQQNKYVDQDDFYYSIFHLIILIQFLKMFQISNQQVKKIIKEDQLSSLKKLIVSIYNLKEEKNFNDISKKDLFRLLSGLSELVQEKPLEYIIINYYQFLKYKSFQSTMQKLGKCFCENKTELQNVFSISNIQKSFGEQKIQKIDEINYDSEKNKKYQIILNEFQYSIFQKLQKQIKFQDIQIHQYID
ncbi:Serine/Threonine kinase domain protein (macronuclear) [Tetrahymena thermophila SB210]|uniref:Serine/Threonine kinase domain protein n=1 Tax=Tetrahymena thermophila (strain SB210) TaxID=312017 RepID=W7XG41_TETTS|nr:Serine/Threonine kinase domain protein [Tetrahymena thermophila SB210]EWS73056.1 Serine/Threonine kinase domain protein [Tetrahymena thermophila SB210]|eukprot:XP_012654453.1 Serine/Threonine kinase domain protein [Tetrahymena thermophila SB210]